MELLLALHTVFLYFVNTNSHSNYPSPPKHAYFPTQSRMKLRIKVLRHPMLQLRRLSGVVEVRKRGLL